MDIRKFLFIIGGTAGLIAVIIGGIFLFGKGEESKDSERGSEIQTETAAKDNQENITSTETGKQDSIRENTLRLAKSYMENGEYQRALDLVDKLLIENSDDMEAKQLQDKIIKII
jgi:hypothetical protein